MLPILVGPLRRRAPKGIRVHKACVAGRRQTEKAKSDISAGLPAAGGLESACALGVGKAPCKQLSENVDQRLDPAEAPVGVTFSLGRGAKLCNVAADGCRMKKV
jgi:hypothetical protein